MATNNEAALSLTSAGKSVEGRHPALPSICLPQKLRGHINRNLQHQKEHRPKNHRNLKYRRLQVVRSPFVPDPSSPGLKIRKVQERIARDQSPLVRMVLEHSKRNP